MSTKTTYSSPQYKVSSKILRILLRSGRVEGPDVIHRHSFIFGQGFEDGDDGVEKAQELGVGVWSDHGMQLVDVVVVELGAGCGGGIEVLGGHDGVSFLDLLVIGRVGDCNNGPVL